MKQIPQSSRSHRQELEREALQFNGLAYFGHNISHRATMPLNLHVHQNCMEVVLVIKGEESYFVGEESYVLSGGEVFASFLNEPHKSASSRQGVCEIYWFQLDLTREEDFLGLSKPEGDELLTALGELPAHAWKINQECLRLVQKSFEAFAEGKPAFYTHALFRHLLAELLIKQEAAAGINAHFESIKSYIAAHIEEEITIEDLCAIAQLSTSTIKHRFKEYTGKTPRDYINERKIRKAMEFLEQGASVTETAMRLGFNSSDYFATVFRRYRAQSPREYREGKRGISG